MTRITKQENVVMLRYISLIILPFLLASCSGKGKHQVLASILQIDDSAEDVESVRVGHVSDGDTIRMRNIIEFKDADKVRYIKSVRYIGIDAPEGGEPFYKAARALNKRLVDGKKVKLEFDKRKVDRYGRFLAYVYVDSLFVNAEMIKRGYARVSDDRLNVKHSEEFQKWEKEAKEQKSGIWKYAEEESNQPPDVIPTEEKYKYVASKSSSSGAFHLLSCPSAKRIKEENKIFFYTFKEAENWGRRPCKICRPKEGR